MKKFLDRKLEKEHCDILIEKEVQKLVLTDSYFGRPGYSDVGTKSVANAR